MLHKSFDILQTLHESGSTIIYKARRKSDGRLIIVKACVNIQDSYLLKHEYEILKGKHIDGIRNAVELFYFGGNIAIVLEYIDAVPLCEYIEEAAITEEIFITIARNAAYALSTIHDYGILHNDIKPENMLINTSTLKVYFIDFGLSELIGSKKPMSMDTLTGTVEYVSPEQTGRIDAVADERSDLYSLGVALYRIITSRLPFKGETPMEIIHGHIAINPVPPKELADISDITSGIIMKLLKKAPNDRYNSAKALEHDLNKVLEYFLDNTPIAPFPLGESDILSDLELGTRLYGKDKEFEQLKQAYERVCVGRGELVYLEGPPESGKTKLLNEFKKYLSANSASIVWGEFEEAGRSDPYYAIREAFEKFYEDMTVSGQDLSYFKEKLQTSFGANGQVILNLFPFARSFMGEQPPLVNLGFAENQKRIEQALSTLLKILRRPSSPIVVFLDNVQWADYFSLRLFVSALLERDANNILVVFSGRSGSENEGLNSALTEAKGATFMTTTLEVSYLSIESVREAVRNNFHQPHDITRELADCIYAATGGKPLEINHYLGALYYNGLLAFDRSSDKWCWDIEMVRAANIDLDIDKKVTERLMNLSSQARYMAMRLACVGTWFTAESVQINTGGGITVEEFLRRAKILTSAGILVHNETVDVYTFASRRVHALCTGLASPEIARSFHYSSAQNLYSHYAGNEKTLYEHSAEIADHFNAAEGLAKTDKDKSLVAYINLLAGNAALDNSIAKQAARYYDYGIAALGDNPFKSNHSIAFELYLNKTKCLFPADSSGELEKAQNILLANIRSDEDKYKLCITNLHRHYSMAEGDKLILLAKDFLSGKGYLLEELNAPDEDFKKETDKFYDCLARNGMQWFVNRSFAEDIGIRRDGSVLSLLASALFLLKHPDSKFYICKLLNMAAKYGSFEFLDKAFLCIALLTAGNGEITLANEMIGSCFQYAEIFNTPRTNIYMYYGLEIVHWTHPLSKSVACYKDAKAAAASEGNFTSSCIADTIALNVYAYKGIPMNRFLREVELAIDNANRAGYTSRAKLYSFVFKQYARCLMGKTEAPDSFDDKDFKEKDFLHNFAGDTYMLAYYYAYKFQALSLHGYYERALEIFELLEPIMPSLGNSLPVANVNFFHSFTLLKLAFKRPYLRAVYVKAAEENQAVMRKYADTCPENFEHKYMFISAGLRKLEHMDLALLERFSETQVAARNGGFDLDAAMVEESSFRLWQVFGLQQYIEMHRLNVSKYYSAIGAVVKSWQYTYEGDFDRESGVNRQAPLAAASSGNSVSSNSSINNRQMDSQMILSIMSTLNHDFNMKSICERFLSVLIQNCGADKGCIIILNEETPMVEAVLYSEPVENCVAPEMLPAFLEDLGVKYAPADLIKAVLASKARVTVNSSSDNYMFLSDGYIKAFLPESFACVPIVSKDKTIGAFYLENAKLPGVFGEDRIEFINAVTNQCAIIIQNAIYYNAISGYAKTVESRMNEHIGQLNALIAGIAHEINSPVGVCVTVLSRMQELAREIMAKLAEGRLSKSALDAYLEDTSKGLEIGMANITRAADLIQNFKKVSVDQSTEVFEEMDLKTTLENIIEYIRPAVKKKINSIDVSGPENLIITSCSGALTQIFTNLIMNAAIHAFEGMDKSKCAVTIKYEVVADKVRIVFTDNGCGMDDEQLNKMFQPFYTTKRNHGGSGLGTHIVLTLVTQTLNGSINCVSAPGKGTSFIINLPLG